MVFSSLFTARVVLGLLASSIEVLLLGYYGMVLSRRAFRAIYSQFFTLSLTGTVIVLLIVFPVILPSFKMLLELVQMLMDPDRLRREAPYWSQFLPIPIVYGLLGIGVCAGLAWWFLAMTRIIQRGFNISGARAVCVTLMIKLCGLAAILGLYPA